MGIFDIFKKSSLSPVQKLAPKVADTRGLAPDRWEAIQALGKIDSEEAVEALLVRFTFYVDPTITDQEEKENVFQVIVAKGELAVAPLKRLLKRAQTITWPLKMLERIVSPAAMLDILAQLLVQMDAEYERDPQRKLQVLAALEERPGTGVAEAIVPFLRDVHEPARFHAVGAALAQEDRELARSALAEALTAEDSMRVKSKILDGFAKYGWTLEAGRVGRLPDAFGFDSSGIPRRR